MKNSYFRTVWGTMMNCLNFKGKASRTEFCYFWLFQYSCIIISIVLIIPFVDANSPDHLFSEGNPLLVLLLTLESLVLIGIGLSKIALVFRRCRDLGDVSLGFLIFIPIFNFLFELFLAFKKGNPNND